MQFLISAVGTGDIVDVTSYTNYGYTNQLKHTSVENRSRSGKLYTYKFSSYRRFRIPLTAVDSAKASTLNSWWSEQLNVNFTENSSVTHVNSGFTCKIVNKDRPLKSYHEPHFREGFFNGSLILETVI